MFSKEEIEKEVAYIFGAPLKVSTGYIINEDALTIRITDQYTNTSVTAKISALEELQCSGKDECSKLLKTRINEMRHFMLSNPGEDRKLLT